MICIFCDRNTARKRGTTTLTTGAVQQVWHCRNCGHTWQTDRDGKAVDPRGRRKHA